jgi:hypothetical protein
MFGNAPPRPAAGFPAAAAPAANGFADAAPLAARRTGGRAPVADLFSNVAQAGSEEDVMTSAPAGMPQAHAQDDKLTGQRNENSVLFSLNALTSKGGPGGGAPMPASSEASGLIDIRQISSQIGLGDDKKKKSRIDDIMNLGGGGAFAPSLGAPVLAAPPIEEYAPAPDAAGAPAAAGGPAAGKNKMIILGAAVAGVLFIAGAIGLASVLMKGKDETAEGKAAASASAMASAASAPSASSAPAASVAAAAASDTSAPSPSSAPTDSTASAAPTTTAAAATAAAVAAAPSPKPAAVAAAPAAAPAAPPVAAAPAAAPPPAAAAAGADQPFNMGEAKAKLGAIAGSVQACKKGDASGSGRVVVTFSPNGGVQSAVVSGAPFEGTPTGACVAGRFRGARVPPFSGSPFSVSKSFSIN